MSKLGDVKVGATIVGLAIIGFIIWEIVTHQGHNTPLPQWGAVRY